MVKRGHDLDAGDLDGRVAFIATDDALGNLAVQAVAYLFHGVKLSFYCRQNQFICCAIKGLKVAFCMALDGAVDGIAPRLVLGSASGIAALAFLKRHCSQSLTLRAVTVFSYRPLGLVLSALGVLVQFLCGGVALGCGVVRRWAPVHTTRIS